MDGDKLHLMPSQSCSVEFGYISRVHFLPKYKNTKKTKCYLSMIY